MPGHCVWQEVWLNDPNLKQWLARCLTDKNKACCIVCKKEFSIASAGICPVKKHAEGEKHSKRMKERSSSSLNNIQDNLTASDTSSKPKDQPMSKAGSTSTLENYVATKKLAEEIITAEIIWTLNAVNNHHSFKSQQSNSQLFEKMFPDSHIAKGYSCSETKARYHKTYGLAPCFVKQLREKIQGSPFVLMFDESLNKKLQHKQLDILLRFWDEEKQAVISRYWTSDFLGSATADDLLSSLMKSIFPLQMKYILQLSMDGPSVNWKLFSNLSKKLNIDYKSNLIDIGSCGLHILHDAFMTASSETGWRIGDLLSAMYTLFKHTPARRKQFEDLTGRSDFAAKYCQHRWLENGPAIKQALKVFDSFRTYVQGVKNKKCTNPQTRSFDIVKAASEDKLIKAKLYFFQSMTQEVEPFLNMFQTDKAMIPFLGRELYVVMKALMERFIKKDEMSSMTPSKLLALDVKDEKNHVVYSKVNTGFAAENFVKDLLRKKKISEREQLTFSMECKAMLVKLIVKLQEKSPLNYSIVRNMDCYDPRTMIRNEEVAKKHFKLVLKVLVETEKVKLEESDIIIKEFNTYVETTAKENEFMFSAFDPTTMMVDNFHFLHMSACEHFSNLLKVTKMVMCLSHGQASIERGFSINKVCAQDNQSHKGLIARRVVLDHVRSVGGVLEVKLTKELKLSCKSAKSSYDADLRENPRNEELKKRKREEEREAILRKKLTMEKEFKELQSRLDSLEED